MFDLLFKTTDPRLGTIMGMQPLPFVTHYHQRYALTCSLELSVICID
uniref:Uncharacterized protein n=1 Tax=Anguilla anguilla TaxID=7936 RepID=A0A0E9TKU8_ANGAN